MLLHKPWSSPYNFEQQCWNQKQILSAIWIFNLIKLWNYTKIARATENLNYHPGWLKKKREPSTSWRHAWINSEWQESRSEFPQALSSELLSVFFAAYCRSDLQDLKGCPGGCDKLHDFLDVEDLESKLRSKTEMKDRCYQLVKSLAIKICFRCFRASANIYDEQKKFDHLKKLIQETQRVDLNEFDFIVEALEQRSGFTKHAAIKFVIENTTNTQNALQAIERFILLSGMPLSAFTT